MSADALFQTIRGDEELARLQRQLLINEKLIDRYPELTASMFPRPEGVRDVYDGSFSSGTNKGHRRLYEGCVKQSGCDPVRELKTAFQKVLSFHQTVIARRPPLPIAEAKLKQALCAEYVDSCLIYSAKVGDDSQGRPVYLVEATSIDRDGISGVQRFYRLVVTDGAIRQQVLFMSVGDDALCRPEHCVRSDSFFQGFQVDTSTGQFFWSTQYNFYSGENRVRLVPELRVSARHFEGYSRTADGTDMATAKDGYDYDTGHVYGTHVSNDFLRCSGGPDDPQAYLIPIDSTLTLRAEDWKTVAPKRTLKVGGIAKRKPGKHLEPGFAVKAKQDEPIPEWFWVTAADQRNLLVEVFDPNMIANSSSWVTDSHLEIWLWDQPSVPNDGKHCLAMPWLEKGGPKVVGRMRQVTATQPRQWGIRSTDGKVDAGYGAAQPQDLKVKIFRRDASHMRMHIELPASSAAQGTKRRLAVAYSVSDGKRQARLLATSLIRYGDPLSFGWMFDERSAPWPPHARRRAGEKKFVVLEVAEVRP